MDIIEQKISTNANTTILEGMYKEGAEGALEEVLQRKLTL